VTARRGKAFVKLLLLLPEEKGGEERRKRGDISLQQRLKESGSSEFFLRSPRQKREKEGKDFVDNPEIKEFSIPGGGEGRPDRRQIHTPGNRRGEKGGRRGRSPPIFTGRSPMPTRPS